MLFGAQTSLIVGLGAVTIYVIIGTVLGGIAGLFGGKADQVIMRATDTLMSIPSLLLVIVFVTAIGPSLASVLAVIGLLGWPGACRLVRGQLLPLRESEFVTAARVVGVGNREHPVQPPAAEHHELAGRSRDVRHGQRDHPRGGVELPRSRRPDPDRELGRHDQRGPVAVRAASICRGCGCRPGVAIALTVLSVNFIGDGLRDALDPKSTRRA